MKNTTYAKLAIKFAVFYFIGASLGQSIQAQSEIRFRLVRDSIIVIPMMAGGEGPFDFILDTGADTTVVDSSLASKLSLQPLNRVQQTTLAGAQALTVSSMPNLAVGPAQVENLPVLVQDLSGLHKIDSHIEGIAGQDFLSHFNYLIDYRKRVVRIEQGNEIRASIEGDRVPIEVSGRRMIVALEAQSAERANLRFLLDSGANSIVLLPRASQALQIAIQENRADTTSSGQVELKVGRLRALTIGSQQFHDLTAALAATESKQQIGDGLLPTALFHAIYVNNREGFVMVNPRAGKN
jgi:predicted aspartyl protease